MRRPVLELLRLTGIEEQLGADAVYLEVDDGVEDFERRWAKTGVPEDDGEA